MKKLFLFMVVAGTVALTSCSKDYDDVSDSIVGTWVWESSINPEGGETTTYVDQWVFNSDNTGNYKETTNGHVDEESAITWSKSEDSYIVKYISDDFSDEDVFKIGEQLGKKSLEDDNGSTVATKE